MEGLILPPRQKSAKIKLGIKMETSTSKKIKRIIYLLLFTALIWSYFAKDNYKSVENINSKILEEPIQTEIADKDIIKFTKNDYSYELEPLYDYEINGFVVNKMDYRLFSIYKMDSVFPMDLCMIWGSNVKDNKYKDESLSFSQDMRFCFAKWKSNLDFDTNKLSNTHLVINNSDIEKKLKDISQGDQLKVKGKLVNVSAKNTGKAGKYDPEQFTMKSSVSREDMGAGACEIIYVEDLEITQKGNVSQFYVFRTTLYLLLALIIGNIIWFFIEVFKSSPRDDSF